MKKITRYCLICREAIGVMTIEIWEKLCGTHDDCSQDTALDDE